MPIHITLGDITKQKDDAIVNSANTSLLAGGGVCGAIHKAAGTELEDSCLTLKGCPTGKAVITPAFKLSAKYVIHAVGPRWYGGNQGEPKLLRQCYHSIFALVQQHDIKSISIPSISTGIYHYPLIPATEIAMAVAKEYALRLPDISMTFVCFSEEVFAVYLSLQ